MSDSFARFFASDKEIYDLLESSKRRMTRSHLIKLARERRIFVSEEVERENIVDYLSSLPHDLYDVHRLVQYAEPIKRAERSTFIEINADVTTIEIGQALEDYRQQHGRYEEISIHPYRDQVITSTFNYNEFDFSRTTLLQRQEKSAGIEFRIEPGKVIVRMPATDKGQAIVNSVVERLEQRKKTQFVKQEISVSGLSAASRTQFFLSLMGKIEHHRVEMVTNVKVNSGVRQEIDDFDDDLDHESKAAEKEMLGVVKNVALAGENLLASPQFQELQRSGFYITSMTWRATQMATPFDKIQFEVSFEDQEEGVGFKYLVRYSQQNTQGEYAANFKAVPDPRRRELFRLIEVAARLAMEEQRDGTV